MPTSGCDRVYLARHGRTALNAEGRLRGLSNPPLDDIGRVEAERLAEALAGYAPTVVISSPLQRAVSTAEAIGAAAGIQTVVDERLNDRDYGHWTGQPRAEVEHRFGSVDQAPGVEPAWVYPSPRLPDRPVMRLPDCVRVLGSLTTCGVTRERTQRSWWDSLYWYDESPVGQSCRVAR